MTLTSNYFYRPIISTGVTAATIYMYDYQVSDYTQIIYRNICLINESSGDSDGIVGVRRPSYFHPLFEFNAMSAGQHYHWDGNDIVLLPHDRLEVRFVGSTDADRLAVYLSGFMCYSNEIIE